MAQNSEGERRKQVLEKVLACVRSGETIKLPDFDPDLSTGGAEFALTSIGLEENPFGGAVGDFRYQFEGEEDLLHLIVTRTSGDPLTAEEGRSVAGFLFSGVPTALVWFRPGEVSQHFYVGHDELLDSLTL